jgi:UDP-2,3-diacylglucosamine pyrophosphatase LpxH
MNKHVPAILAASGVVLIAVFFAWAFSIPSTFGLFKVNGQYHSIFLYFGLLGFVLLLLLLLYPWLRTKLKPTNLRWLTLLLLLLSLPGIIIPPVAYIYASSAFSRDIGDTPPQLLLADGTGAQGIPNLALTFNTMNPCQNTLTWGEKGTPSILTEETPSKQHVFMLRDLEPLTEYTYRINEGVTYSFNTPPANGDLHFAMGSDAHFGAGDNRADLAAKMLTEIADPANAYNLFFFGGDLVEYGFSSGQWSEAFRSFSTTTSVIPARFAIGNHESLFAGRSLYQQYAYPEGMDLETGSKLWYRIDVGNIHFLVLDIEWSAESYTNEQAEWLEEQLEDIPVNDWKLIVNHGFYYASGSFDDGWNWYDNQETINALAPLFEKYGVDLVLCGHDHQMEFLRQNGVSYAICGSFGGLPDTERSYISPASLWYMPGTIGFLDVSITKSQAKVVFRNSENEVLNSFFINHPD